MCFFLLHQKCSCVPLGKNGKREKKETNLFIFSFMSHAVRFVQGGKHECKVLGAYVGIIEEVRIDMCVFLFVCAWARQDRVCVCRHAIASPHACVSK